MPKVFDAFPKNTTCPLCNTGKQGKCVLVTIAGTADGNLHNAHPVHTDCILNEAITWSVKDSVMMFRTNDWCYKPEAGYRPCN